MSSVKNYFDTHSHSHAYHYDPRIYVDIFKFLHTSNSQKGRILDLGCGDGSFLKAALTAGISGQCLGSDVSLAMIKTAQKNLKDFDVDLIVCDGFTLPFNTEIRFDLIHIDSVLHHLIGKTRKLSLGLVRKMLRLLKSSLSDQGLLVIEEVYYDSFVIRPITTSIIFYALKIFNFIHFDFSKIINEIQLGLEVNFMPSEQIQSILQQLGGDLTMLKNDSWKVPLLYRFLLLKERGHITYLLKP